jgi:hypothetical protein
MLGTSLYKCQEDLNICNIKNLGAGTRAFEREYIYVLCAGSTLKAFWFGAIGTVMGAVVAFGAVGHFLGPNGWKVI